MKFSSSVRGLVAIVVIGSGSAFAANDKSAADIVNEQQSELVVCAKNEIGKVTKVEVVNGKEVAKLTKGGMKVDPAKKFAVIYSQRGKNKTFDIPNSALAAEVTAADLTAKLVGKPACVMEPQD